MLCLHLQAVIIPIVKKETDREPVMAAVAKLEATAKAAGFRVKASDLLFCGGRERESLVGEDGKRGIRDQG
jgi:hypothetical protein